MYNEKAKIFKALSDPNRLKILKLLQEKTLCVCEIRSMLKLANSTVSQHLSVLKEVNLIVESKNGKWVHYSINPKPSNHIVASVLSMLILWLGDINSKPEDLAQVTCASERKKCK